ncbi:MAG: hypothetical protein HQ582_01480, partial [Planctomycetes bacterium]|nr:hypothetical protein [Planctomycetota bacterium]
MKRCLLRTVLSLVAVGAAVDCAAAEKIAREALGRSVKLTILVDKVMQPEAGWVTEEWMVEAAAEAGFNVFSPRVGYERLDEVGRVTEWCTKHGIFHMPWMRGSLSAPAGPTADGKRVVWSGGSEQPLWSPNSDEFWKWTTRYVVEYAKRSAQNEHLMGVFLDYENYAPGGKEGNLYYLSYDDVILTKFAESKDIGPVPAELSKRKPWLEERGLHDEFAAFQVGHWRERCRRLREAVDAIEPTFQFCIYPAPGTPFMVEAAYPEWATDKAPLILGDASTYGRASRMMTEREALEANRQKLLTRMEIPRETGIPFIYTGGIDPVVRGADPEFSGKNAVTISEATDGYWIFYEGPSYKKQDHADYWKWFTWANRAIAAGKFEVRSAPRETAETWLLDVLARLGDGAQLLPPQAAGKETAYPVVKLRGENVLLAPCKAGQSFHVKFKNHPVGRYTSPLVWELREPSLEEVATGTIPHDGEAAFTYTPRVDGIHLLAVSSGSCAYSVVSADVPLGLYTGESLHVIHGARRLYFQVPDGVERFTIGVRGTGAETVRLNVFDPEGAQVATGQTSLAKTEAKVEVDAADKGGKTWSLELTKADEGVLEDVAIRLDPKLAPSLSLAPGQV